MSNHNGGCIVGIEMDDLEREEDPDDLGDQPMEERSALTGSPFKDMFQSILMAYDNERTWWVAVENLLLSGSGDFTAKVNNSSALWRTHSTLCIPTIDPHTCRLHPRHRQKG